MEPHELQGLLDEVVALARRAGDAIMDVYESSDFDVQMKGDDSPLTKADLAANAVIVEGLKALTPAFPILSEESKQVPYEERRHWATFWLVDPLDGTKEFIRRNGEFTVNIALVDHQRPVLGVVYAPVLGLVYFAARQHGACRREGDAAPTALQALGYQGERVKIVASRSHAGPDLQAFLENVGDYELVSMGSSLKLCLVAQGAAHLYPRLGPTMEWDTAAAHCVASEAGATVTDPSGRPLIYNKANLLNPYFVVAGAPAYPWREPLAELPAERR